MVYKDLERFRYREAFHLSYVDAMKEPPEAIAQASFIWSVDRERDNLELKRQELAQQQ